MKLFAGICVIVCISPFSLQDSGRGVHSDQRSVKFILKNGLGNVVKEEQVSIADGKSPTGKLEQVLDSTNGYITVVYRDHKRLLTRIEKLQLPEHLPEETIPAGGLVIHRSELPWEPSINPVDAEDYEDSKRQYFKNFEYLNIDETSSSARTTPEQRLGYQPGKMNSNRKSESFKGGKPQKWAIDR